MKLVELALKHGTDKEGSHSYPQHYDQHFSALRDRHLNILEIGIGGYDDPHAGGAGLRMWKEYFCNSQIIGLDFYNKEPLREDRIDIFKGSQADPDILDQIVRKHGSLDIIIDDGSHQNAHVLASFKFLFPHLKDGGIYVIEDTQTAYWPALGGTSDHLHLPGTSVGFFKERVDGLNHRERIMPGYSPTYFDLNIRSLHFYHNMIFIYKGDNSEPSNHLVNNTVPRHLVGALISPILAATMTSL
jgi:hypothetical protein